VSGGDSEISRPDQNKPCRKAGTVHTPSGEAKGIHAYCSFAKSLCRRTYSIVLAVCAAAIPNTGLATPNECAGGAATNKSKRTAGHQGARAAACEAAAGE